MSAETHEYTAGLDTQAEQHRAVEAVAVLKASLDCIIVIDAQSRVLEWNPASESTFQYSRDEAIGQDLSELIIPPTLRSAHRKGIEHYLATGDGPVLNRRIEIMGMRRGGEEFPVELTVVPIVDNPPRFTAYLRDIVERRKQEEALRNSEERFRSLVEATAEIVWLRSPSGEFQSSQPGWSEFTGVSFEGLDGFGWLQAIHPDDRDRVAQRWAETVKVVPDLYQIEYRLRRRDGEFRNVSVRAVPVREADGAVREWIGVSTDVTERKEAEVARQDQAAQQRRFVREMLASVTEGRLRLCESPDDLPAPLALAGVTVVLTATTLRMLRKEVQSVAEDFHLAIDRVQDLITAVGEAGMNAVKHGGGGGVGLVQMDPATRLIQVWIKDHGAGIRQEDLHRATLEKGWSGAGSLGHGFFLILRSVDRTFLLTGDDGTTIVLEQEAVSPQPSWL